jgi:hypothetical protein
MSGTASAIDLLESAPAAPTEVARWLLTLQPLECEAVYPAAVVEMIEAQGADLDYRILDAILAVVQAQARRLRGEDAAYRALAQRHGVDIQPTRRAAPGDCTQQRRSAAAKAARELAERHRRELMAAAVEFLRSARSASNPSGRTRIDALQLTSKDSAILVRAARRDDRVRLHESDGTAPAMIELADAGPVER